MALARFQRTIVDGSGNVIPSPFIEVRRDDIPGTPLAILYSDREGTEPLGNPFQVDTLDGFAAFHVAGGAYKIRAYTTGFERIWRYVGIGTNSETDFGVIFTPRGAWDLSETYTTGEMVSHENSSGSEPYAFVSNQNNNLNHPPQFDGDVGASDSWWTVLGLLESPGIPGEAGSSDVVGTSTSSVAIGTGTKTFTIVEADRGWGVGARLRASSDSNPTGEYMEGVVTSYSGNTLEISSDLAEGAGSHADWTINLAGEPGGGVGGGSDYDIRVITAAGAVTVAIDDEIILMNKTVGAATTINFPAANTYIGRGISIKDIKGDAQTNNITPAFNGAETCDGLTGGSFVIDINYGEQGVFRPLPSGAGWFLHKR